MRSSTAKAQVVPLRPDHAPLPEPDGHGVIEAARKGDLVAWNLLYRQHYAAVLRHLCALVGRREIAEDLAQDTFARAMASIEGYSGRSSLSTWLHGVALNVARNHWRSNERATRAQTQLELLEACRDLRAGQLDRVHQQKLRVRILFRVLDELSTSLREAFVLRYIEGLGATEAAERLGIEAGAVRVRAHRARQQVETRLRALGWVNTEATP
ncbi:MAG: RNA polymerase sigma factor [Nannocystaceae bacterium]|nr:RNA polymerase sigma factor [bacterium]